MFLSVFDVFKIGIGPSSSHTMGPMVAAGAFLDLLRSGLANGGAVPSAIEVSLHGSLAFTGKGHATDRAVLLGLCGFLPDTYQPDEAGVALDRLSVEKCIRTDGLAPMRFDPETSIRFDYGPPLPGHPNGLIFAALADDGTPLFSETYYSIGGGFVLTAREMAALNRTGNPADDAAAERVFPYPFRSSAEMLDMGRSAGLGIAQMKRLNEVALTSEQQVDEGLTRLINTMHATIDRGLSAEGILPGGLGVKRRAPMMYRRLCETERRNRTQPHVVNDWISVYAMAVNEENAAGGQVVTAPTNGAAGVIPAVLRYYRDHCVGADALAEEDFLLTAAAIGGLIKTNASISGAEVGCQGEVGSASAMAAAGLCGVLGGSNAQIANAAEIALEHHLGMTCDPVGGLVQVPCIERNAMGAIKAVAAASLALYGDGTHFIPLDNCIETMRQTGLDMNSKYKETSQGGLAVNMPAC